MFGGFSVLNLSSPLNYFTPKI